MPMCERKAHYLLQLEETKLSLGPQIDKFEASVAQFFGFGDLRANRIDLVESPFYLKNMVGYNIVFEVWNRNRLLNSVEVPRNSKRPLFGITRLGDYINKEMEKISSMGADGFEDIQSSTCNFKIYCLAQENKRV